MDFERAFICFELLTGHFRVSYHTFFFFFFSTVTVKTWNDLKWSHPPEVNYFSRFLKHVISWTFSDEITQLQYASGLQTGLEEYHNYITIWNGSLRGELDKHFPPHYFCPCYSPKAIQSPHVALCHLLGHTLPLCVCQENYVSTLDKLPSESENVEVRIFIEHHTSTICLTKDDYLELLIILGHLVLCVSVCLMAVDSVRNCHRWVSESEDGNHHSWQPPSVRLNASRLPWNVSAFVLGVNTHLWFDLVSLVLWVTVLSLCQSVTSKLQHDMMTQLWEILWVLKSSNAYKINSIQYSSVGQRVCLTGHFAILVRKWGKNWIYLSWWGKSRNRNQRIGCRIQTQGSGHFLSIFSNFPQ